MGFDHEGDQVWVWVAASLVVFAALSGVLCCRCGVGGGGGFGHGVGNADVDVIGGGVVGGDNVEDSSFVLWSAAVGVKFGDVDFQLCVVAVLLKPFL